MSHNPTILDELLARLERTKGHWPTVARESGVPYFTMMRLVQRRTTNPQLKTVQALMDYFDRQDRAA